MFSVWKLEQGFMQQQITLSQYKLAQREAKSLLQRLKRGKLELLEVARQHYKKPSLNEGAALAADFSTLTILDTSVRA
jgi:hypothetical protein